MNTIDTIGTLGTVGAVVPVVPALPSLGELTEEEVQWLREQDRIRSASASASTVTPVTVVPVPVPALDFKDMQEKATAEDAKRRALEQQQERQLQQDEVLKEIVHKLHCGTAAESLAKTYGSDRVALAEQEQRRTPATTQQSFIKHRSQERANNRELGKALAASGASIQGSVRISVCEAERETFPRCRRPLVYKAGGERRGGKVGAHITRRPW